MKILAFYKFISAVYHLPAKYPAELGSLTMLPIAMSSVELSYLNDKFPPFLKVKVISSTFIVVVD